MVEQNGGKFQRLKKDPKYSVLSESKNSFGESHCLMFRFGREN